MLHEVGVAKHRSSVLSECCYSGGQKKVPVLLVFRFCCMQQKAKKTLTEPNKNASVGLTVFEAFVKFANNCTSHCQVIQDDE